jgi:hypothetical protein
MDAWTGQDGHFAIANVAPGTYRILAAPLESDSPDEDNERSDGSHETNIILGENESKSIEINLEKTHK